MVEQKIVGLEKRVKSRNQPCMNGFGAYVFGGNVLVLWVLEIIVLFLVFLFHSCVFWQDSFFSCAFCPESQLPHASSESQLPQIFLACVVQMFLLI